MIVVLSFDAFNKAVEKKKIFSIWHEMFKTKLAIFNLMPVNYF